MVQSSTSQREPKPQPVASSVPRFMPVVLILLYLGQCLWFIRTQSLTYDEPAHIVEGLDAWRNGRFEQYNDHPPLARLLCTLPLISAEWRIDLEPLKEGFRAKSIMPDPVVMAWRARVTIVCLGLLLGWLLWFVTASLFSGSAATAVLALFAFSPSLIAHFSLATTDGAATLLLFAVAWQLVRWRHSPDWSRTILLGIALGLMLLAKFSTVLMFGLAAVWMLILTPEGLLFHPRRWNWTKTLVAVLLAALVLWGGYFFHVSHLSIENHTLTATFPNWQESIVKPVQSNWNFRIAVPAGEYIEGFRTLVRHNRQGQAAYFLGEVSSTGGWKLYYPIAILLKWPTIVLLLSIAALIQIARRKVELSVDLWILFSFPAVYLLFALFARFNIGERHVLPLYPFALLLAGALWQHASERRMNRIFLVFLIVLNAVDCLRIAPDYLSYFNLAVSPDSSYRLLSDSNLDWGQGLIALRQYERMHPQEPMWLAYFGSVDPAVYGIKALPLAENQRVTGTVIVSATNLSGQFLQDPQAYRWLLKYPRVAVLNHSLFVFKVD